MLAGALGYDSVDLSKALIDGSVVKCVPREKSLTAHYAPGDMVEFQRDYRSLGVEKGDERRVVSVDHATGTVMLEGRNGEAIPWQPRRVGGRRGAVEVYRAEPIELRASDCIR